MFSRTALCFSGHTSVPGLPCGFPDCPMFPTSALSFPGPTCFQGLPYVSQDLAVSVPGLPYVFQDCPMFPMTYKCPRTAPYFPGLPYVSHDCPMFPRTYKCPRTALCFPGLISVPGPTSVTGLPNVSQDLYPMFTVQRGTSLNHSTCTGYVNESFNMHRGTSLNHLPGKGVRH